MSTYKFLPKQIKEVILFITEETMEQTLNAGHFQSYTNIIRTLSSMHNSGDHLSSDQQLALLHPVKKWGNAASWHLNDMVGKADKKPDVLSLSPRQMSALRDLDGEVFKELWQERDTVMLNTLHATLKRYNKDIELTSGQQEFLQLCEAFL